MSASRPSGQTMGRYPHWASDFSSSRQMNLVHASDGPEASAREIGLYFKADEVHPYTPCLNDWFKASDE